MRLKLLAHLFINLNVFLFYENFEIGDFEDCFCILTEDVDFSQWRYKKINDCA